MRKETRSAADAAASGHDPILRTAFQELDPARADPGYWLRLHQQMVVAARPELARRRAAAMMPTMSEVLFGWSRTLIPTAVLAAAVAAMLVVRSHDVPGPDPMGIEELLTAGLNATPIPVVLSAVASEANDAMFTSESY